MSDAVRQPQGPETESDRLLAVVRALLTEIRGQPADSAVSLDARLDVDLGLDSLAVAELLVRVQNAFDVAFPDEVLATARTPRDLLGEVGRGLGRPPVEASATRGADLRDGAAERLTPATEAATLIDTLRHHATAAPGRTHIRLLGQGGEAEEVTYGALWEEALAVAAGLRQRQVAPGTAVSIMLPTSREYFVAFFGTVLAGAVPAPIYPPARPSGLEDHLRRHVRILDNAQAAALITVPEGRRVSRLVTPHVPHLRHVVTVDELQTEPEQRPPVTVSPSDLALLQYTSGSTGDPKGVMLSHDNLLANIRAMIQAGPVTSDDVFVSWLPLYHDMGLIGSWLLSLYMGIPFIVMSPLTFLARPVRWLQAITEHGATLSGGPNFGYELCLRRIDDADLADLDLRTWRIAFNGAEPVSPETVTRFTQRFSRCGLAETAMTPVFGLAESTVDLTIPAPQTVAVIDRIAREPFVRSGQARPVGDDDPSAMRFVACGRPLPGHDLRIVDQDGTPLPERRQGRIQFRGPSATSGYYRNPNATRRLFDGDWLDSGDLGYLADGELYVTGRVKDLIIRAGRNLHPSEIEEAVGAVDGVRQGCVAVFPSPDPDTGTERLIVMAETRATDDAERARISRAANEAATDIAGAPPDRVVLVPPGSVPKTSSGKIRRAAARERFESGDLARGPRAVWRQIASLVASSVVARGWRGLRGAASTLYGVWTLAVFAVVAAVTWPAVVVVPGVERRWAIVRRAGRLLLAGAGIPMTVTGAERLKQTRPAVVVANHASYLDSLVLALLIPGAPVFAAREGFTVNPLAGLFLDRLGAYAVKRGDRVRGVADIGALTDRARNGSTVVMFPEGRRTPAPGLEPFHTGPFLVAADAGIPVVPVGLRGTRRLLPVGQRLPRRSSIEVEVLEPLAPEGAGWAGAMALLQQARAGILEASGEPDLGR